MNRVSILDCTLRDGGYINDWAFGRDTITGIIHNLNEAGIEIIECGFLRDCEYNPNAAVFPCVSLITPLITPKHPGTMYVAMIALGDISPEKILPYDGTSIDGIRLTFHKHEWEEARQVARELMEKGYRVFVQPVGTTSYSDEELLHLISDVNILRPYALYLVDTLGIMYRHDMMRFFYLIDHNLNGDIRVGFHSHNNLQLSFSNAQELIHAESSRPIIIDASVYGMGRGVGNLSTELLAEYINVNIGVAYGIIPLLTVADRYLMSIYAKQRWGYDLPYFLSATEKCHPNYASFLLNKGTLNITDISKILSLLPANRRDLFDAALIEEIYMKYQSNQLDDSQSLNMLTKLLSGKKVLVLGPGSSVRTFKHEIEAVIASEKPFVISINFIADYIHSDIVFISNRKRMHEMSADMKNVRFIVATSNLTEYLPDTVSFISYSRFLGEGLAADNAGAMLIRMLKSVGADYIYLAGLDGFEVGSVSNYCVDTYQNRLDRDEATAKNQMIGRQLRLALSGVPHRFITPTKYEVN